MLQIQAPIVRRDALSPAHDWVTLHAPEIAVRARPGQLLAIRAGSSPFDPLLRRPVAIAGADTAAGSVGLLIDTTAEPPLLPGAAQTVDLLGPIGRGWDVDARVFNLLLLGTDEWLGALLFLANLAGKRSWNVTLLVGAEEGRPALPPALVPPAIEYQFAHGAEAGATALELVDDSLLRWADVLFTTLPLGLYSALAARIRASRVRWAPGFARGLVVPPMACFTGICDTCLVEAGRRQWRACVDGPQCDLRDFVR